MSSDGTPANRSLRKAQRVSATVATPARAVRLALALLPATLLCASPAVRAQSAAAASSGADQADALQEVVVTAQHTREDAQKTPIAMSVYGGDFLKQKAITSLSDLSAVAPDVNFSEDMGSPIITIRGISSLDTTEVGDPAVTVNTDGFYLNRPYSLDASLYDLDRIEVLRGPQGTLNGRNSVGGAINVVTAAPTNQFASYFSLSYGNFNALNVQGMVNLPINDALQIRASFMSASHDGYRDNSPQIDADDQDDKSARLEVAFEPFDKFKGLVTVQYTNEGGAGDAVQTISYIYNPDGSLDHNLPPGINSQVFPLQTTPALDLTDKQIRWNFAYDAGLFDVITLGGYDTTAWHHNEDESSAINGPLAFVQNEYPDTLNEEVRLASHDSAPVQWQVGAFYFQERSHLLSYDGVPSAGATFDGFEAPFGFAYQVRSHSTAGYAQGSYQLTDALKITAGVRYTADYKGESGYYGDLSTNTVYANQDGSETSDKTTYHLALDYDLTAQNLLYAKYDTGYKAGGFNFGAGAYKPETVSAYEIGSKNRFLNDTMQLNLAAFIDNYNDQQVSTYTTIPGADEVVALTENAGRSRLWGIESDLIYKVPVVGTFNATADYLHARYTYFLSAADPSDPTATGNVQLAGNTPPQAPTWSISFGLTHDWAIPKAVLTGRIETKYQTEQNFSFYNFADTRQGQYTMSSAFLTYAPDDAHWKVTAYVRNLENAVVFQTAQESEYAYGYAYQWYPPRTFGLRLETSW